MSADKISSTPTSCSGLASWKSFTPFLRTLSDTLPNIADWQRKALLGNLEFKGVLRMEKRTGISYDFTVFRLNYSHPTVREMM